MILDEEMLGSLRDSSLEYQELRWIDYSDGVISGINLSVDDNKVVISKGIIKVQGKLYKILIDSIIDVPENDGLYICGLKLKKINEDKFLKTELEVVIEEENKQEIVFEFFRIKRREGAELRKIEKFTGQLEEYNLLNVVNLSKAGMTGEILPKILMIHFAEELLKKQELEVNDKIIAYSILNGVIERKAIETYIQSKHGKENKKNDLNSFYVMLCEILQESDAQIKKENKRIRKMMVE